MTKQQIGGIISCGILCFLLSGCGENPPASSLTTQKNQAQLKVITGCDSDSVQQLAIDIEENLKIKDSEKKFKSIQKTQETFNENDLQEIWITTNGNEDYYIKVKHCKLEEIRQGTIDGNVIY